MVSATAGKLYNRLFDARQKADYADLVKFSSDDVARWLDEAKALVHELEKLIHQEINRDQ